jgi:selenocysteine lyase/cysteine desulfurase
MSQQIVKDHSLEALQVAASWAGADRVTLVTSRFAYTACGGYKWLLSPRGTAYFTISPTLTGDLTPQHAGRYAGDDPWSSVYGGPPRLASDARRFDVPGVALLGGRRSRPCGCLPR